MKKLTVYSIAVVMGVSLLSNGVMAQKDVVDILSGSLDDAEVLAKAYLEPFTKSFGTSLNNGWYNTAKPHGLFGFDITFTTPVTLPPSSSKTFDVSKLDLNYWRLKTPADNLSPTVSGAKTPGVTLTDAATGLVDLQLPQGANLQFVPAPIIQFSVGLPFHTELIGRYFPKVDFTGIGSFNMWGIGVKNEFKEFIPVFKHLPFRMSLLLGYTKFNTTFDISTAQKQTLNFEATGFTSKLLISKSIPVLTVYAGVGFNHSTTNVDLKGVYNIPNVGSVTDPLSLQFNDNGVNANIGLRIRLAILAFHFDYAVGKYSIFNAGVGISFR